MVKIEYTRNTKNALFFVIIEISFVKEFSKYGFIK